MSFPPRKFHLGADTNPGTAPNSSTQRPRPQATVPPKKHTRGRATTLSPPPSSFFLSSQLQFKGPSTDLAHDSVAKDPNVRFSTRIRAAKNAAQDKLSETKNKREADVHKNAAKHNY